MSDKKIEHVHIDDLTDEELRLVAVFNCIGLTINECYDCCFKIKDRNDICFKTEAKCKLKIYSSFETYENIAISKGPLLKHKIIKE